MTTHTGKAARIQLGFGTWMLVMVLAFLALMALIVVGSMLNQAAQRQDCLKLGGFLTDTGQCVKVTP